MAGRIRDEDIAAIRERAKVDEVVGDYVTLRNAGGGSLKGLCPFHDERSPSFHVTPARGLWYCFGCGTGGDVISFLQRIDHLSFNEAVEQLAERTGLQLTPAEPERPGGTSGATGAGGAGRSREQRTRLLAANRAAAAFYAEQLSGKEALPGRRFLAERGFDRAAAEQFGVGYASRSGHDLRDHLRDLGVSEPDQLAAGLLAEGRHGTYDRFRGRLVWPIRDLAGDVVGFGARRLYDDDRIEAKYLNTPETVLYRKSQVLYGVDMAKREIARQSRAVVVEGYTDVMACHLAGVPTAVATCGTAFGDDHARIIRRLLMDSDGYRGEVVFTFDGDEAGRRAALRAFEGDQRFVAQTYVAIDPNGHDPCEVRLTEGDAALRELVARRQPMFEFAIRSMLREHDLDHAEGRASALQRGIPVVARIRDAALRDDYARRLAGWVGADEADVLRRVRGDGGRPARRRPPPPGSTAGDEHPALLPDHGDVDASVLEVERAALRAALQRPTLAGPLFDDLDPEAFASPAYRAVAQAVRDLGGVATQPGGAGWVQQVGARVAERTGVATLVTELAVEPMPVDDAVPDAVTRYVDSVVHRMHEIAVTRRLASVKARLQRTDPGDSMYPKVFAELMSLEKARRDLRERAFGLLA
jgi:DNA primase